ncbi:hypothetical protein [Paraburkholderia flagellata]|uniref:hypothetical protein n=1 Tax=Paraburkholderia flagellata TaxID=2883241 RepID=UPI001F1DFD74|nr:hypothetical protein [Paraburkholderia flagellata]
MHQTIELLMENEKPVGEYFAAAKQRWSEILADITEVSVEELAERLTREQFWFEHHCGGRWVGQEVMVWSGFASIYATTEGYDCEGLTRREAAKLAQAFARSMVSVEVRAKRATPRRPTTSKLRTASTSKSGRSPCRKKARSKRAFLNWCVIAQRTVLSGCREQRDDVRCRKANRRNRAHDNDRQQRFLRWAKTSDQ